MERHCKDDGSSTAGQFDDDWSGTYEIQDTLKKQKYKHEGNPQFRKTGVDQGKALLSNAL